MHFGTIPGPISMRCDNYSFTASWIKYVFQSAITVISHTLSFIVAILWIRFLFSSYYHYQASNQDHKHKNDISAYIQSILFYLPFSSWIWIALCLTNTLFFVGFMMQTWIIPILWNFEGHSNAKLFRCFALAFILIVIACNVLFSILQILSYSQFYSALILVQMLFVMISSFVLLFVIIKNGTSSMIDPIEEEESENGSICDIDLDSEHNQNENESAENEAHHSRIYQKLQKHSKHNLIAAFSNYSCSKLLIICTLFSFVITATVVSLFVNFRFVLCFILKNNIGKNTVFDTNFVIHSAVTIFGTLLVGEALILIMRILMRWLIILLSDSYNGKVKNSMDLSFGAHYDSMQSFNRMILFMIPLLFIIKLSVFVMLYTFTDPIEFAVAIIAFCLFSRCFNKICLFVEDKTICKLTADTNGSIQDHHLKAQCKYIHDIIHYIAILLIPAMFALFNVNLSNNESASLSSFHYLRAAAIQFSIQSLFDLLPFIVIFVGNPMSATNENFYQRSGGAVRRRCCAVSEYAMHLKVEYVNMMNGWTATDQCVRYFMWWCTIFIGGYFCFYLLYPQQFLCVVSKSSNSFVFGDWAYVPCK